MPACWLRKSRPGTITQNALSPPGEVATLAAVAPLSHPMLRTGILNPHVLDLLARIRHTNTLVIADRGFPFWPQLETVDLSLVDDVPTVLQVYDAIAANFVIGRVFAAKEFKVHNSAATLAALQKRTGSRLQFEPHLAFKRRVPQAIGLIRTGDTIPYANLILESA